ncbi:hypothetical protein ACLOJK_029579, partial [Asimina triloba]
VLREGFEEEKRGEGVPSDFREIGAKDLRKRTRGDLRKFIYEKSTGSKNRNLYEGQNLTEFGDRNLLGWTESNRVGQQEPVGFSVFMMIGQVMESNPMLELQEEMHEDLSSL